MKIVDRDGFQSEFQESPKLSTYSDTRVSRILGHVPRLSLTKNDDVTLYDFDVVTIDGGILRAFGKGTVYASGTAEVYAYDEVRVLAFDTAKVRGYGHASITCSGKATGVGYERSRLTFHNFASGELHDFCTGSFHNFAEGTVYDQANGYAYDTAIVEIHGNHTSVRARGRSSIDVHDTPAVWLAGSATAHVKDDTRTKFIVTTGKSTITPTPIVRPSSVTLTPSATPTQGYQEGGSPAEDLATVQGAATAPAEIAPEAAPAVEVETVTEVPTLATEAEPIATPDPATVPDTTITTETASTDMSVMGVGIPLPLYGEGWTSLKTPL